MKALAWKEKDNEEFYEKHVISMLCAWEESFKAAYVKVLSRIFHTTIQEIDKIVKSVIILHDTGKLFIKYQTTLMKEGAIISRADYRHELVSASFAVISLSKSELTYIMSGAILLHHEPILMGQISRYAEPHLTITDVERRLRKVAKEKLEFNPDGIKWTSDKLRELMNVNPLPNSIRINEILESLKELMLALCIKCVPERKSELRLKVATLSTLLSVIDSYAASRNRGELDDCGTFITKRAKKAEVSLAWL